MNESTFGANRRPRLQDTIKNDSSCWVIQLFQAGSLDQTSRHLFIQCIISWIVMDYEQSFRQVQEENRGLSWSHGC